jgi:hypothetical protein
MTNSQAITAFRSADSVSIRFGQTCPDSNPNHPSPCPLTPEQESFKKDIAKLWNETHPDRPSPIAHSQQPKANNNLAPRSHYGWIGSFADSACNGDPAEGPRPKLYSNCVPFAPSTDTVGISWGGWPIGIHTLKVFESDDCSGAAFTSWSAPQNGGQGPGSCVDVGGFEERVGSVMSVF